MDLTIISVIVQLVFLEGILSIDNAAVLGAMVAHLPTNQPIPWPKSLSFLSNWGQRTLGNQRDAALKVGLLGAYIGRGLMLVIAGWIIQFPWLRLVGALYLMYLAIRHFGERFDYAHKHDQHESSPIKVSGFWATVVALELADLAFSIDNVIAAVALSDKLWVVMLGVAIGIVVMRFAAAIFSKLIQWDPAFETSAFLLLLVIGGELILHEYAHITFSEIQQFAISVSVLFGTILIARSPLRKSVIWLLWPFRWLCYTIVRVIDGVLGILWLPFQKKSR
jgi:tellurite resistance protein TerC